MQLQSGRGNVIRKWKWPPCHNPDLACEMEISQACTHIESPPRDSPGDVSGQVGSWRGNSNPMCRRWKRAEWQVDDAWDTAGVTITVLVDYHQLWHQCVILLEARSLKWALQDENWGVSRVGFPGGSENTHFLAPSSPLLPPASFGLCPPPSILKTHGSKLWFCPYVFSP